MSRTHNLSALEVIVTMMINTNQSLWCQETHVILTRIASAAPAFLKMRHIWKSIEYLNNTKLIWHNFDQAETWRTNNRIRSRLRSFDGTCLRRKLQSMWEDIKNNQEIAVRTGVSKIDCSWWGMCSERKPWMNKTSHALTLIPVGKRKAGMPTGTRRGMAEEERMVTEKSWNKLRWMAQDRVAWRHFRGTLCSSKEP